MIYNLNNRKYYIIVNYKKSKMSLQNREIEYKIVRNRIISWLSETVHWKNNVIIIKNFMRNRVCNMNK